MSRSPRNLFGVSALLPLGGAMDGDGFVVLHTVTDAVAALALLAIAAAIAAGIHRRRDLPAGTRGAVVLIVLLLAAGALSRLVATVVLGVPAPGAVSLLDLATGAAAVLAAVALWRLLPTLRAPDRAATRTRALEDASRRYGQALARASITLFAQDKDLRDTWVHNLGGSGVAQALLGSSGAAADESLSLRRRVLETGETASATVAVSDDDGSAFFDLTASATRNARGVVDGIVGIAVDVTERRLVEMRLAAMAAQLATAYQRFDLALENSPISVFEQDAELRYTYAYNPPPGTEEADFVGRLDGEVFADGVAGRLDQTKRRVLASGERETFEVEVEVGGEIRFLVLRLEAKTDEAGTVVGIVSTALDLTERRRDEKRIRLMLRELTHRSKNLLAVVQAMARKTANLSQDPDAFVAGFSARLRAMAAAHDLLVSQSWHGADLGDLIRASVAETIAPNAEQVRMDGPSVMLAPETAQNLGLAFHELATNASKYGALAADGGLIDVSWRRADGAIRIRWLESDGPPVEPPTRRGFGRVLLERLVGTTLNGSVELEFRPSGVACEIVFPDGPTA